MGVLFFGAYLFVGELKGERHVKHRSQSSRESNQRKGRPMWNKPPLREEAASMAVEIWEGQKAEAGEGGVCCEGTGHLQVHV